VRRSEVERLRRVWHLDIIDNNPQSLIVFNELSNSHHLIMESPPLKSVERTSDKDPTCHSAHTSDVRKSRCIPTVKVDVRHTIAAVARKVNERTVTAHVKQRHDNGGSVVAHTTLNNRITKNRNSAFFARNC
jgi:hypothetical protein